MNQSEQAKKLTHKLQFEENRQSKLLLPASAPNNQCREKPADKGPAARASAGSHVKALRTSKSRLHERKGASASRSPTPADYHKQQKHSIKQQYAVKKNHKTRRFMSSERAARKAEKEAEKDTRRTAYFFWKHKWLLAICGAAVVGMIFMTLLSSTVSLVFEGTGAAIAASTYPSADADMLAAEEEYCSMEDNLLNEMNSYGEDHPEYDEVTLELDEIWHDPYVLISALHALHGGPWTIDEIMPELEFLFSQQYIVTVEEAAEEDEGRACTVTLENRNLSHLPVYTMSEDQMSIYSMYMATLGNRPDLFPDSEYVAKYFGTEPLRYEIPPEALEDEDFAAMIKEAEKYLGFPYVWGGSSPSTSFDCSGYVSWVLNQCGWNVGRMGCIGLMNYCTLVSADNAKPGDLIFFVHTYDAPEPDLPTHVGIYVGGGMMIHCGDPISYASVEDPYWQSHFYAYGRLPEK